MKLIKILILSALLPAFFTSCLTLPGNAFFRSFKVNTEPSGATVEVFRDGEKIDQITTPGRIYITRSGDLVLKISKPGYSTQEVTVPFVFSPVRSSVSFFGGMFCIMIPFGVDYATGVLMVPAKSKYNITLVRRTGDGKANGPPGISYQLQYDQNLHAFLIEPAGDPKPGF